MNWDDLPLFLALLREGSLSGAARALGVEHATVARRMDRLEQALGLRLFERLPRGWRATPEALALMPEAEAMEQAARALRRRAEGAGELAGPVRLSAPPLFQAAVLVPLLPGLMAAQPGLSFRLDGQSERADLQSGEVDLALRVGAPEGQTIRARKLGEVAYRPYRSSGSSAEGMLMPQTGGEVAAWTRDWAGARPIALVSDHVPTQLAAAKAGMGIAVLPVFLVEGHGLEPVDGAELRRPLYLALHEDKARAPRVRRAADALAEALRGVRARLG